MIQCEGFCNEPDEQRASGSQAIDYSVFAILSERYETGWLLSDTLAEYLDGTSPVSPDVEDRILELLDAENPE